VSRVQLYPTHITYNVASLRRQHPGPFGHSPACELTLVIAGRRRSRLKPRVLRSRRATHHREAEPATTPRQYAGLAGFRAGTVGWQGWRLQGWRLQGWRRWRWSMQVRTPLLGSRRAGPLQIRARHSDGVRERQVRPSQIGVLRHRAAEERASRETRLAEPGLGAAGVHRLGTRELHGPSSRRSRVLPELESPGRSIDPERRRAELNTHQTSG